MIPVRTNESIRQFSKSLVPIILYKNELKPTSKNSSSGNNKSKENYNKHSNVYLDISVIQKMLTKIISEKKYQKRSWQPNCK